MGSSDQTPARSTATLAIIMPSSLFSETSAERFRRESQEMWDKVQSEGTSKNDQTDQVDKQSDEDIKNIPVETKREARALGNLQGGNQELEEHTLEEGCGHQCHQEDQSQRLNVNRTVKHSLKCRPHQGPLKKHC